MEKETIEKTTAKVSQRTKRVTDDKNRKKDEKYIEQLLRCAKTDSEKITAMSNKCVELLSERRNQDHQLKLYEKNVSTLKRDYDQAVADKNRQILINSRLENLCRELQKQNKAIKEETCQRIKDEEEKRKEVSTRFQTTINEINSMMQEGNDTNAKLRDDNVALNAKFQILCQHVEKREEQVEALIKQMELERKLAEATIEQRNCEILANMETYRKEKEIILAELEAQKMQCTELRLTSENLRQQIIMYKEQCDDFHSAVIKSNNMFETFQTEMDKMTKKLQQMEKESITYHDKWKKSNLSLIEMYKENEQLKSKLVFSEKQLTVLKDLCRAMQNERNQQRSSGDNIQSTVEHIEQKTHELNLNDSESTVADKIKELKDDENESSTFKKDADDEKLKSKENTLQILKSSLNILQQELNVIQKNEQMKCDTAQSSQSP